MSTAELKTSSATGLWRPYEPSAVVPWDLRRVVHLHRRAGFAATWPEIERDLADGPQAAVSRLLEGRSRLQGVPDDFERLADVIGDSAVASAAPSRLKAWWLYRMLFGLDPLTERLALMWHSHFATSNLKVDSLAAMRRQNQLFRQHARAPFAELLFAVMHDPALLDWLDASSNRKGHPNENLARESMELFTLGIGHYSEDDVREAARALTGWSTKTGSFRLDERFHDDGEKTILGRSGTFDGDAFVQILLEHSATAQRVAWRISREFLGEGAIAADDLAELAAGMRERDLEVGWAVETVLRSRAFFAEANLGACISAPVQFVVGAARALEMFDRPPSTLLLAEWSARLGQDLFYPPNVGGWTGGRHWLSSRTVIGRTNFALALVGGALTHPSQPLDAFALARKYRRVNSAGNAFEFYDDLLLGGRLDPATRETILRVAGQNSDSQDETLRQAVAMLLARPEAQLT